MEEAQKRQFLAELLNAGAVVLPSPRREGFEQSAINEQTREYIIDREALIEAVNRISRISWQNIDASDRKLALLIRENVMHSLGVMASAMAKNEERML